MSKLFYILIFVLVLSGCKEEAKIDESGEPIRETMDSGILDVVCDESIVDVMDSVFTLYDNRYDKVKFSYEKVSARKAMALLLSGNIRAAVIARDYLKDEDSLMKEFNVEPHLKMVIAEDALVFYTKKDFPVDTINASEIKKVLKNELQLKDIYPDISAEPIFAVNNQNSSDYANVLKMLTDGQNIKHPYKLFNGVDSVKTFVRNNDNSIGIGYMSHVVNDNDFKMLRVGFYNDSTKKQIFPQDVHQAYVLMRKYPFIIRYYVYLLKNKRDLPYWFGTYLAKETVAQKYFLDYGIVPTYAKFKLNPQ
jgi:phosphate transport system substrate-binding protein